MTSPNHDVRSFDPTTRCASTSRTTFFAIAAALVAVVGVGLAVAERSENWWWDNLAGPDSSNFMNLDQINKTNVSQLEVAWFYPYATIGFNPIVVDDVMYTLGRNNSLIALDASTGKEIWIHEGLDGIETRGINYWQNDDGTQKRLLLSINSFLQAIDAKTGQSISTFGVDGIVNLRDGLLRAEGTSLRVESNSPGKVWKDLLILGSAPGEGFVLPPGDIRAYNVITGKRVWQFHTVPWPGEYGYDTRPKENWKYAGGTNNWGSMAVDDARGIVYIPTGSSNYDFYGADRIGQDLFANCLLALDARTGTRLWHFQTVHHDLWDYDNVSAPQLITVMHNGKQVDAVAQASKTGFLYVFNRVTGEPLWPIEERPVPQSDVPGEQSWPTQPFPTKPPAFSRHSFTVDDVNSLLAPTPAAYQAMRDRVAKAKSGKGPEGGIFNPPGVDYDTISMPGNPGGSNWGTTAADPKKGMVFVVGVNQVAILKLEDIKKRTIAAAIATGQGADMNTAGAVIYQQSCQECHGADLRGAVPGAPSLVGIIDRMDALQIRGIVTGGQGAMHPTAALDPREVMALVAYLASTNSTGARGAARGRGPAFPAGPVVASGGAPQPTLPARGLGPFFPGIGGNAGNNLYPADIKDLPSERYMSQYNFYPTWTKPPYTTLTAYDLNTGEIKWQMPDGDDLSTLRAGGPHDTGGINSRNNGIVVTKGLVFHAGSDGKVRAYDEDTGNVLWSGTFGGITLGVPVAYESKGREFIVITAAGGGLIGRGAAAPPTGVPAPTGSIAFALPKK